MLKITNLEKKYRDFHLNCSLEVPAGRVTGLIGANGAGKSTLIKAMLGLISTDNGEIKLFGKSMKEIKVADKEKMGVVLAESGFSGYLSIRDLIPILSAMYHSFEKEKFESYCKQYDLPLDKKIKDFSTGMKAKLKVLVAITHQAGFLVLDEPTIGLDVLVRDELLDILRAYMEEDEERSILISSHISSDLEGLCDDLYMIDNGQIVLHEEVDTILDGYGILKVTEEQYQKLEQKYILRVRQESFGYACLTDQKQFYLENYPDLTIEKGSIDEVISFMVRGEKR